MTGPLTIVERDDVSPKCPHCNAEIETVYAQKRGAPLIQGRTLVFFCPHCHKVLGFRQERVA